MLLKMIASVFLGDVRVIEWGDSLHQTVMIVYVCIRCSYISIHHNMRHLCTFTMFHTQHTKFFATFDTCASTMWFGYHKKYMC